MKNKYVHHSIITMDHSKISILLSNQEYQQLLSALEELPYKKVHHLIGVIKQAREQKNEANPDAQPLANVYLSDKTFQIGDRVRARWLQGSAWYTGKIR